MSLEKDIALLRGVATFDMLNGEALRILAISAEMRDLTDGETLFRAGETADCAYVVSAGLIHLVADLAGGDRRTLYEVKPGALIGETALVAANPRPATAVAAEPSRVMRVSRSTFLRMLEEFPEATAKLRRTFARRLETTMRALDKVRTQLEDPPALPRRR